MDHPSQLPGLGQDRLRLGDVELEGLRRHHVLARADDAPQQLRPPRRLREEADHADLVVFEESVERGVGRDPPLRPFLGGEGGIHVADPSKSKAGLGGPSDINRRM